MGFLGLTVDVADLINFIEGKISNLPEYTTALIEGIGEDVRDEMMAEAPYITGDLRRMHTVESIGDYTRIIFSDVPHFEWVVGGTPPHWIYPVEKKALYWPGADHPVKSVYHPGTQPNDYPLRALEGAEGKIEGRINDFLDKITEA